MISTAAILTKLLEGCAVEFLMPRHGLMGNYHMAVEDTSALDAMREIRATSELENSNPLKPPKH